MTADAQTMGAIRLMDAFGKLLLVIALLLLTTLALAWVMRLPMFEIRSIHVVGEVTHYNASTLGANVVPCLKGTFFTLNLDAARKAFEAMPWIRQAVVKRNFPNRITVQLQEHQPVALWGTEGDEGLLNSFGEVFDADAGDIDQDVLPRLYGPQSASVWATYRTLQPVFAARNMTIRQLEFTPRGSWRVKLNAGTIVELGSGSVLDMVARVQRLLQTVSQVTSLYHRHPTHLALVDLRHPNGYAIRLGPTTTTIASEHDPNNLQATR